MPNCRGCGNSTELVDSHIIPEWAYKSVYTKKHKFAPVKASTTGKVVPEQKGYREPLLCRKCETYLSRLENDLFKDVKRIRAGIRQVAPTRGRLLAFADKTVPNYSIFKRSILSILWRMSISARQEFKNYSFGGRIEAELHDLVFNENRPMPWSLFPIAVFRLTIGHKLDNGIMMLFPETDFAAGIKSQSFAIYGLQFIVYIYMPKPSEVLPTEIAAIENVVLKEAGRILVADVDAVEIISKGSLYRRLASQDVREFYKRHS